METKATISVIIPTYNRKPALLRLLGSLQNQTIPLDHLSVIIVDDGSSDDTPAIAKLPVPFDLRYVCQKNQGATAARNYGAALSCAEILVFIDDDVTISPGTLEALAETCCRAPRVLAMGTIIKRNTTSASVYTPIVLTMAMHTLSAQDDVEFHFVDCNTELLACRRSDFQEIGMFHDPTDGRGWPNWDDVDFGYRANQKGFRLVGSSKAVAEHWDDSIADRVLACHRFYRAGRSAVLLFERHPELKTLIPMLRDKTPLVWGHDSPRLIARKLARQVLSSQPSLWGLTKLVSLLERHFPSPTILRRLYYLLHGANLFQGYGEGLRELGVSGA